MFDPATGKQSGSIAVPEGLEAPWTHLRVQGEYLVGSSGAHILCLNKVVEGWLSRHG